MQKRDAVGKPAGDMCLRTHVASPSLATADSGKVRMGAQSPAMPPVKSPSRTAGVADNGNVRLGAQSPAMPRK